MLLMPGKLWVFPLLKKGKTLPFISLLDEENRSVYCDSLKFFIRFLTLKVTLLSANDHDK